MNSRAKKIIALAGDIIILYLSLYLTLLARYQQLPSPQTWENHFWPFSLAFLGWIIIFYISDLYNINIAVNNYKFTGLTARSVAIAGLLTAAIFYLSPHISIAPKTNLAIFIIIFSLLFLLWRQLFNWVMGAYLPKTNIAFIGHNAQVKELASLLKQKPQLGYKPAFIISTDNIDGITGIPATNKIGDLSSMVADNKISTIVLAADPHRSNELRSSLFSCLPLKINFVSLSNFYEAVTGKVPIDAINQMWFLENLSEGNKRVFDFIKRLYDLALALLILVVTAIFWPLVSILIKIDSPGPAFFTQKRVSKDNKNFTMIKFRTMATENNDYSETKINDQRVTRLGAFLRKTRIDEIPQVLNILTGDMSFVGPRPERPEFAAELAQSIPFYKERTLVKPGLTGWDQISGEYHSPSREDTLKKLQYDLYYIKNRSLYLDLSIVLKTIATVFSRKGL